MIRKISLIIVIFVILGVGLYYGHHYYWWFSPAYSQRQTISKFLSYVSQDNLNAAYAMTSPAFKQQNSLVAFKEDFSLISNDQFTINYKGYQAYNNGVSIVALVHDKTANDYVVVGANVIKATNSNNIDSIYANIQT